MKAGLLLDRLCIKLGFCLPPNAYRHLLENRPNDSKAFTNAVFVAEGCVDPATADRHLYRKVLAIVSYAFRESDERRDDESRQEEL
jgi:hypothetical protein